MNEIKPLLYRPPLLPEETLPSYLYRLAAANLLSPFQLETLISGHLKKHDNVSRLLQGESIDVLAKLTNLESYKIFWASEHSLVTLIEDLDDIDETVTLESGFSFPLLTEKTVTVHLRWVAHAQFCPFCLREAAYQRRAWRVKKVAACIHHECLLVDQCPGCNRYLLEHEIIKATCRNCLYPLADATTLDLSCDQDGLDTQRLLYFWLNAGPHIRLPLPPIPPRFLYLLASQMMDTILKIRHGLEGLHPVPHLKTPYIWKENQPSSKYAYVLWATAIKAMLNWPANFHRFLENRGDADISGYSSGASVRKGWWLSGWLQQWPKEKNQIIHDGIATFLHDNYCWGYVQERRSIRDATSVSKITPSFPAFTSNFVWARESIALRLLNVRPELFRQLVHGGLIRGNAKTLNIKDPLISREDVLKVYDRWEKGIPLDDVEPAMHISRDLAYKLVNASILDSVDRNTQDGGSECLLEKGSVNRLISTLSYKPAHRDLSKSAFYSLDEACNLLAPFGYDEVQLFQLALEKHIPALLWKNNTLGDILFQRKAIRALVSFCTNRNAYISVSEFCDQFQIDQKGLSSLLQKQLISHPLLGIYLYRNEVELLREKYYSFQEARKLLKIRKPDLDRWIKSGALPVAVKSTGCYRDLLFLKEDVEKLLPDNRCSKDEAIKLLEKDKSAVDEMIREGELRPFSGPGIDGCSKYYFLRNDLAEIKPHPFG